MLVDDVKAIITRRTGVPTSVFRLVSNCPTSEHRDELYNGRMLVEYGLRAGSVIWMEVWDGWVDYLLASERQSGEALVTSSLSFIHKESNKDVAEYKQRVALYIAAFQGYLPLATCLLNVNQEVSPGEPVGVHPCKGWFIGNFTPCDANAPIHAAACQGHLAIVRLFAQVCPRSLVVEDANGLNALDLSQLGGHGQCAEFIESQTTHWQSSRAMQRALTRDRRTKPTRVRLPSACASSHSDDAKQVSHAQADKGRPESRPANRDDLEQKEREREAYQGQLPALGENSPQRWSKAFNATTLIPSAILRLKRKQLSAKRRQDEPKFSPEKDFANVGVFRDPSGPAKSRLGAAIFIDGIHSSYQNSKSATDGGKATRRRALLADRDRKRLHLPPIHASWLENKTALDGSAKFISPRAQQVFHLNAASKTLTDVYEKQCASGRTIRELAEDSIQMAGAVCGDEKPYLVRLGEAVDITRRGAKRRKKLTASRNLPPSDSSSCSQSLVREQRATNEQLELDVAR